MFEKLPPKILVVESDEIIRTTMCNTIERYWFSVVRAGSAAMALSEVHNNLPNVVIISSKLTTPSVLSLIKDIHSAMPNVDIPIIVLLEENEDKEAYSTITGPLVAFIHRQFTPNELMLAIKALLKQSNPVFQDKVIKYKDLSMDLATYRVQRGNKQIHLGPTEFKIMQMLVLAPRTILSRQHIMEHIWGKDKDIEPRTVDVHVNRIRSLIKLRNDEPPLIKTVRSGGYCLNLPGERD